MTYMNSLHHVSMAKRTPALASCKVPHCEYRGKVCQHFLKRNLGNLLERIFPYTLRLKESVHSKLGFQIP